MKTITYVTHPYLNKDYFVKAARAFANYISDNSNDYNVELLTVEEYSAKYNNGTTISDSDYIELVDQGKTHVGQLNIGTLYDKCSLLQVLSIPYLVSTIEQADKIMETIGVLLTNNVSNNSNTIILDYTNVAQKAFVGNEISKDIDSWNGLNVTSFGFKNHLNDSYLTLLGLNIFRSRTLTSVDDNINKGVIDLREIVYLPNEQLTTDRNNLNYFIKTDHGLTFSFFCINKDFYNSLNDSDRELFSNAAKAAAAVNEYNEGLPGLEGFTLVEVSDEQKQYLKTQMQMVVDFYPDLQDLYNKIKAL